MADCVNPNCPRPENRAEDALCRACGSKLALKDRYLVSRPLGKGGFGATFLAVNSTLPGQPPCVIKQLRPNSQAPTILKMARELFEREAFTLGKIGNHPQIPQLLDYFEEGDNFYLIQEYVEGETLKQEFERRRQFTEDEVRQLLMELLPALGFIHENGVIHRDVKPANIIRRKIDDRLVLIDFGAVSTQMNRATPVADEDDPGGLLTNFAIGTPGFAPPEQMAMRPVYSSDIYATAMTCLYLMTGRSPKDFGHDPYTGEVNWRSQVQLSPGLTAIFEKMLHPSTTLRYRSAEEALRALEALSAEPVSSSNRTAANTMEGNIGRADVQPGAGRSRIQARSLPGGGLAPQSGRSSDMTLGGTRGNVSKELKGGRRILADFKAGKRNFASQDFSKISLAGAVLPGIVLSRSKLVESDFCHADLTGASFQGALMTSAKFSGASLRLAKMQRAVVVKGDFGKASLERADLREANLQQAYLGMADLSNADLSEANLRGAYLINANLRGANLCGADLKGAKVTEEQLAGAKTNWSTIRPDGSKRLF
ncbi:MAG TPA: serine/threonine protein kinase [Cyanobacteria bacterium UBA8156]|nr:serine/threonine protein kinase [Cyanobacteria bacterium UBA8156]